MKLVQVILVFIILCGTVFAVKAYEENNRLQERLERVKGSGVEIGSLSEDFSDAHYSIENNLQAIRELEEDMRANEDVKSNATQRADNLRRDIKEECKEIERMGGDCMELDFMKG